MAKRAIPPFLVPVLGALALIAAFLIHADKNGRFSLASLYSLLKKNSTPVAPLPPKSEPEETPARPDAELFTTWQGKPVPEILSELTPDARPTPALLTFPEIEGIDPYRPRFVPNNSDPEEFPGIDDAAVVGETLVLSSDGQLMTLPGLATSTLGGRRLLPADFDGDGDTDLFIGRGAGLPSSLLRRSENDSLEEVTTAAGLLDFLDLSDAAWLDFDRDGRVDLFTVSRSNSAGDRSLLRLYRNNDGNQFTEISRDLRLTVKAPVQGFLWHDVDGDSFPDLLLSLAGEPGSIQLLTAVPSPETKRWSFADATRIFGLDQIPGGGPLALGDFDHDSNADLVIASDNALSVLVRETENKTFVPFSDVTEALDLGGVANPSDLLFEDFDGDGFLDLAVTGGTEENPASRAWWNRGGLRFREIPGAAGLITSARLRRLIRIDHDGDGIASIFLAAAPSHRGAALNPTPELIADNARAVIRLRGSGAATTNGFGARLSLVVRDENWTLSTINRFVNEVDEVIGIGPAKTIESITVSWPDREGSVTRYGKLPVNHRLELGADPGDVKTAPLTDPTVTTTPAETETETGS